MNKTEVVLSFGSNMPDGRSRVEHALRHVSGFVGGMRASEIYSTPSVSGDGSIYLNAVAAGYIDFGSGRLTNILKEYELECGRDTASRMRGEVPIDIDVVMFDGKILRPKDASREYFKIGYLRLFGSNDHGC